MHSGKTLVLVDGSSLAFRSFFALFTTGLRNKAGVPTWAVLGFFNSLFELIEKYKPEMLAVSFDMAAPTFRHDEFEDYKAHRSEMPDDLAQQWPLIKEGVQALGLPVYELEGYEADDVIGSLARLAESKEINVLILTGDQDAFQLVDGETQSIKVLMPGKGGLQLYGRQEVFEKIGVWPEQIVDYKSLCGDTSDNIPGVRGIGPKTAVQLLTEFKSLEGIYKNIDAIKSKSVKEKLLTGTESAQKSKRLATIRLDVPIEFDFDHCLLTAPPSDRTKAFFEELEFKTTLARLPRIFSLFSQTASSSSQHNLSAVPSAVVTEELAKGQLTLALDRGTTLETETAVQSNPRINVGKEFDWQIITSDSDLERLVERLKRRSVFSLYILCADNWYNVDIYGYAFGWSDDLSINRDGSLKIGSKTGNNLPHAAYIPIKNIEAVEKHFLSL